MQWVEYRPKDVAGAQGRLARALDSVKLPEDPNDGDWSLLEDAARHLPGTELYKWAALRAARERDPAHLQALPQMPLYKKILATDNPVVKRALHIIRYVRSTGRPPKWRHFNVGGVIVQAVDANHAADEARHAGLSEHLPIFEIS